MAISKGISLALEKYIQRKSSSEPLTQMKPEFAEMILTWSLPIVECNLSTNMAAS